MSNNYCAYWEGCWKESDSAELCRYLDKYYEMESSEIEVFKAHKLVRICDAACGFGAYSLAFASNGFQVHSFDISETAVEMTRHGLERYGMNAANVKVASILDTGYADNSFDGVVAHAVLDHLVVDDAKKTLQELFRITKPNGLVFVSFDMTEEDDWSEPHITHADGTMQYTGESRKGMLFCPYDWDKIMKLLEGYKVVYKADKGQRERVVILQKGMR